MTLHDWLRQRMFYAAGFPPLSPAKVFSAMSRQWFREFFMQTHPILHRQWTNGLPSLHTCTEVFEALSVENDDDPS